VGGTVRFKEFINQSLMEGGNAIKGVTNITQSEVRASVPDLLKKIQKVLDLPSGKIKLIGSAGKKPNPSDLSGDLDIAVECDPSIVENNLKTFGNNIRVMKNIGVFSFAYDIGNKLVQVDLMPVKDIKFAEWSFQANEADIAQGLKGAQRNELFFAIAKHMPQDITQKDKHGETITFNRYFYDLARGLMTGVRTRVNTSRSATKNGKLSKNFSTIDKKVISSDPEKICNLMFGKGATPKHCSTFDGALKSINSDSFPYLDNRKEILKLALKGIKDKNLKVPKSIL
jgi:hypothetical protein